jgi:hypothetical protein
VTVIIGLDKNTKLKEVFERYVAVCNQTAAGGGHVDVTVEQLEFVHSTILKVRFCWSRNIRLEAPSHTWSLLGCGYCGEF